LKRYISAHEIEIWHRKLNDFVEPSPNSGVKQIRVICRGYQQSFISRRIQRLKENVHQPLKLSYVSRIISAFRN